MKILFAIQGTGNGHISRAREIIPYLQQHGELDLLVSGTQSDVKLPYPLKYKLHGLSFTFGKKGGVDIWDSFRTLNSVRLFRDIRSLPVEKYDVVINDFEPVSAWACRLKGKECISLSHQAAFLSPKTPRPSGRSPFAETILKHYAPGSKAVGFHFEAYDDFIHTPVIRSEIRALQPELRDYITVYLPAYSDLYLLQFFQQFPEVRWEVFSKHSKIPYRSENVEVFPISNEAYNKSLEKAQGLITGGGFEAPTEALFLGKKIMVIPMTGQYEQQCNALGAEKAGCTVVRNPGREFPHMLEKWLNEAPVLHIHYPDETEAIINSLF